VHRIVALIALVTHFLFMGFVLLGGFLAWLVPWVLLPHVASAAWGTCVLGFRRACPLSIAENWGRVGGGRPRLHERGFVAHYFEDRLYPASWARRIEFLACSLVFGSWVGLALR
jgi:hypothetical protein